MRPRVLTEAWPRCPRAPVPLGRARALRTPGRLGPGAWACTRALGCAWLRLAALATFGARLFAPHSSVVHNSSPWPHTRPCPWGAHAHSAPLATWAQAPGRAPVPWVAPSGARCARYAPHTHPSPSPSPNPSPSPSPDPSAMGPSTWTRSYAANATAQSTLDVHREDHGHPLGHDRIGRWCTP